MAMSAGMVSHNNPFKRKNMNPQNPNFFIQLFTLICFSKRNLSVPSAVADG